MSDFSTPILAPVKTRLISTCIDMFIFLGLLYIIGYFFGIPLAGRETENGGVYTSGFELEGNLRFVVPTMWIILFPIIESLKGWTIRKKIMGIEVLTSKYAKVSFLTSFVRHLFDIIDAFLFLGFIIAANNKYKQRIGDLVANTIVVIKNDKL